MLYYIFKISIRVFRAIYVWECKKYEGHGLCIGGWKTNNIGNRIANFINRILACRFYSVF